MTHPEALAGALAALDQCGGALRELEARCCEPLRSPSIRAVAQTLAEARTALDAPRPGSGTAEVARPSLQSARAQTRRLQAECCAPDRMPFYTMILEGLTEAQRALEGPQPASPHRSSPR